MNVKLFVNNYCLAWEFLYYFFVWHSCTLYVAAFQLVATVHGLFLQKIGLSIMHSSSNWNLSMGLLRVSKIFLHV